VRCVRADAISIEPWDAGDLPLLQQLMGDPEMMQHLGGPESSEKIAGRLERYIRSNGPDGRMFKILDGATREPLGSVGYWERTWRGNDVYETGWSVLPAFQGQGIAVTATLKAIDRARADGEHRFMHALPSVTNARSNAICKKLDFALLGECEVEYPPGSLMVCNDWRLDLSRPT
jgi:RimJ/RimL family protein N-acetyltransferase